MHDGPARIAALLLMTSLLNPSAQSQEMGPSETFGSDGRLFSSGDDDYYLLSRQSYVSEDSAGYEGQLRIRRKYANGGYEIKIMDYTARCSAPFDNMVMVTIREAGSNDYDSGRVDIKVPDRHPGSGKKPSYNLFWAVCRNQFRKFK
jgi:hypothetical protein